MLLPNKNTIILRYVIIFVRCSDLYTKMHKGLNRK